MAHYRKIDGKWEAEIELGRDPATGKRKRRSKRFKRKKDAKKWVRDMKNEESSQIIINAANYTLSDLLEEWLEDYASEKSPTTYDNYELIVKTHLIPALGQIKLKNLQARHLKRYFKAKRKNGKLKSPGGLSGTTLLHHYHALSGAFRYARKWGIMKRNILEILDPPKKSDYRAEHLSKEQVNTLLEKAKETSFWTYTFLYLAVKTGMRRGELLGLKWSDIEFNRRKLSVRDTIVKTRTNPGLFKSPKSAKSVRPILVSQDVIDLLKEIRKKQMRIRRFLKDKSYNKKNLVFIMEDGSKVIPRTAYNRYTKVFVEAGLSQFNLKSLRHTHATFMLQAGVHPKIVQERLGHSSIKVTLDIYSHVIPTLQEEAVNKFEDYLSESETGPDDNVGEMSGN